MFINSPRRTTNGLTTINRIVQANSGSVNYATLDQAVAASDLTPQSTSVVGGRTSRGSMTNGVISFKRYRNTAYLASYASFTSESRIKAYFNLGGNWQVQNLSIGLGYTGFFNTGFSEYLDDLNPSGGSGSFEGIANRALLVNLRNQAISECLEKCTRMKLDLSESVVGIPQTIKMVAETAGRLLRAGTALRKGDVHSALHALHISPEHFKTFGRKNAAEMWLELQYGWMPLVMDIYNGVQVVNDAVNPAKSPPEQLTCVRRVQQRLLVRSPTHANPAIWPGFTSTSEGTGAVEVRYRFRISDPNVAYLNSIGLLNPLSFAWAATPFSFVLDWLLPVGTWLKALSAPLGLQFVSGYATTKSWGSSHVTVTKKGLFPPQNVHHCDGQSTAKCEKGWITRTVYTTFPGAALYFRFPLSSDRRVANAISLIETSGKRR